MHPVTGLLLQIGDTEKFPQALGVLLPINTLQMEIRLPVHATLITRKCSSTIILKSVRPSKLTITDIIRKDTLSLCLRKLYSSQL